MNRVEFLKKSFFVSITIDFNKTALRELGLNLSSITITIKGSLNNYRGSLTSILSFINNISLFVCNRAGNKTVGILIRETPVNTNKQILRNKSIRELVLDTRSKNNRVKRVLWKIRTRNNLCLISLETMENKSSSIVNNATIILTLNERVIFSEALLLTNIFLCSYSGCP